MITPLDSRVMDANSEAMGVSVEDLMGNAGRAVASFIESKYPGKTILFVCGTGNNGGDGFAAASLMDEHLVTVALLKDAKHIRTEAACRYFNDLRCEVTGYDSDLIGKYDVIVDCAIGTGLSGIVKAPYRTFIEDARNLTDIPVISVDVPSGLDADISIKPTATITFHDLKTGMDRDRCGEIIIADIGIPAEAVDFTGPGDFLRYPIPKTDSHKGNNGKLMIIAGGPYFGAPIMAAQSALRTGADIVRLFIPETIFGIVAASSPVITATPLKGWKVGTDSLEFLLKESASYDAILIGPGLGTDEDTIEFVRGFVRRCDRPMVIDADAISAVKGIRFGNDTVLTPHHMEYRRIGCSCDVRETSESIGATVLLKGPVDEISDGRRTRRNRTGTPAMTGAGTGDVLAGCVSALLSKGMSAFDAACLGAMICGLAGEYAAKDKSYGLIATDVIDEIPHVLRDNLR